MLPTEVFPNVVRSSFFGLSAGMGKVGALLGGYAFTPIANAKDGLSLVYLTCAAVSILGVGITHFFVAPARRETFRGCGRAPAATAPQRAALDDGARASHGLE